MKKTLRLLMMVVAVTSSAIAAPDSMILYRGAGNWYGSYSISNGFNDTSALTLPPAPVDTFLPSYGFSHATPMVGDINGDGMDDMVVAQDPGDDGIGVIQWASAHSTDTNFNGDIEMSKTTTSLGNFGDATKTNEYFIGDITGDGIQDMIVLRKGGFNWDVRPATTNGISNDATNDQLAQFGTAASDMPIVGDFNGDGMDDVGVWRNNAQTFVSLTAVSNSVGWVGTGDTVGGAFGSAVWDIPLVGDINGDGRDDLVVVDVRTNVNQLGWVAAYGQADGQLDYASGHSVIATFGWTNDVPMLADVNGDGMDDMVVVRNGNQWFCAFTGEGGDLTNIVANTQANFGLAGDIPLFGKLKVDGLLPIGDIVLEQLVGTNGLALTWFTTAGYNYALETKSDLTTASWTTNTTVAGIGGDLTVTTAVDQAQSFYRVIGE
ncbi:MAG: hypothetical protein DRP64_06410 [Verrucomicrobia bacterium]|nr:MAG: hypothetical protein DRP64_06410 [Verrucomicrobiota bacterium]